MFNPSKCCSSTYMGCCLPLNKGDLLAKIILFLPSIRVKLLKIYQLMHTGSLQLLACPCCYKNLKRLYCHIHPNVQMTRYIIVLCKSKTDCGMCIVVERYQPQPLISSSQELVCSVWCMQLLNLLPSITSARQLGQLQSESQSQGKCF